MEGRKEGKEAVREPRHPLKLFLRVVAGTGTANLLPEHCLDFYLSRTLVYSTLECTSSTFIYLYVSISHLCVSPAKLG